MDYPFSNPVILTDTIYTMYGGVTGTSTPAQRSAAYLASEILCTQELGTFLAPATVTGTYPWPFSGKQIILPYHHILGVYSVIPMSPACYANCDLLAGKGCSFMLDDGGWGYILVRNVSYIYGQCCTQSFAPLSVQITYLCGLTSGSNYQPNLLLALTKVAKIILNEMDDPGGNEGGEGDPGILQWSTTGHSELRKGLVNTALGSSAAANLAARLMSPFCPKRCLKLGW